MKDLESKQNVLQEIMDLMDAKEGDSLKSHPKLMAAKIEVAKPVGIKMLDGLSKEEPSEEPEVKSDDEVSEDDLKKLLEHFQGLK